MLTITREDVAELIPTELWPLLVEHREEVTTDKAIMVLAPDMERYRAAQANGALLGLVAREDGRAVGYSINFLAPALHYTGLAMCTNDVLFVDRDHRAFLGLRLMRATEQVARRLVPDDTPLLMCWHAKADSSLDRILRRRRGYRVQDVIHTKEIT